VPFSQERLLLFSFVDKPALDVKLNIRGRFIGQQSIPQFDFLRSAIIAAVQKDFVEPNRGVLPLEYSPVMVCSQCHCSVRGRDVGGGSAVWCAWSPDWRAKPGCLSQSCLPPRGPLRVIALLNVILLFTHALTTAFKSYGATQVQAVQVTMYLTQGDVVRSVVACGS
jgi:hypothetical protein